MGGILIPKIVENILILVKKLLKILIYLIILNRPKNIMLFWSMFIMNWDYNIMIIFKKLAKKSMTNI